MNGPDPIRNAGFIACLIGVAVMIAGRFSPSAPLWLISLGVACVALGWGLFAWSIWRRWSAARAQLEDKHG